MNQAQTVVSKTQEILGDRYRGDAAVRTIMTAEDKKAIVELVLAAFRSGETGFAVKESNAIRVADERELRNYVVGLCNNHWRKHKALNGGVKYEPTYKILKQAA
jgi:hypothetical protein